MLFFHLFICKIIISYTFFGLWAWANSVLIAVLSSFNMLWQVRPSLDNHCQIGVFLQDFVQAGGQDRILVFRKCFIISGLLIFVKGFESPWGYFIQEGVD
jgi:hypothetical protein